MPPRGRGGPPRGGGPPGRAPVPVGFSTADHIDTVGVKRPGFGSSGQPQTIIVNSFETTIPKGIIHHYDVIMPSEKVLPARLNMELIKQLQENVAPQIFTPRGVYDGRKNLFAARELPLTGKSQEFDVALPQAAGSASAKGPKIYKIRLTKVDAVINPETLARFIQGQQSHDNSVLTAITALNVVIRMEPSMRYPSNVRSFFTDRETKDIGSGLILWRGYFQSARPGIGKMLINVDISTGTMYKPGPLLGLCLEFLGKDNPNVLAPKRGFPDRERLRLQRFISGIRIITKSEGPNGTVTTPRVLKKLSSAGASSLTFTMREGGSMTVAQYFQKTQNKSLQFPDVICAEVGSGALIPLELCLVPPGQIMRKQVPPEKTKSVLDFATKKPHERLASIKAASEVLQYGQSEYVRQFGMAVNMAAGPVRVQARVLKAPTLRYGAGSKQPTIVPRDGAWNMMDKRFYKPQEIGPWAMVIYEQRGRFNQEAAQTMADGLISACRDLGMRIAPCAHMTWENGQGDIIGQLNAAGKKVVDTVGRAPSVMVVVLPEGGNDIYTTVKHFGDVYRGVPTQCLKSSKCNRAKQQYFANVGLKLNVKLGGINLVPDSSSASALNDPHNPTIVMGADVVHPAPGSVGKPSFTSLVANVDSDTAKYIAQSRVQTSRQEMIEDLQSMAQANLQMYMAYRQKVEKKNDSAPKRIIFYRDGVSEGQFQQVLDQELAALKKACQQLGISPKITIIVVGKRHHVRFFPQGPSEGDRSGNCRAGTVVDRDIAHPTEFDFYLQSHGGLLGTSRPAHYSVLYDENNFSPDTLQSLSFTLCHVYARSTRSVSIPAPVYYADIVCARSKNHYTPGGLDLSESATQLDSEQADVSLEHFKQQFKPVHPSQATLMFFS